MGCPWRRTIVSWPYFCRKYGLLIPLLDKAILESLGRLRSKETIFSGDGMLLTSTLDIARRWKEYTEDLLNPTVTPSIMEADPGDEGDPCLSLGVRSLMQLNKCSRRGVCSNCRGIAIISKNFCARLPKKRVELESWFRSKNVVFVSQNSLLISAPHGGPVHTSLRHVTTLYNNKIY